MLGYALLLAAGSGSFWTGNELWTGICGPQGDEPACNTYVAGVFDGANTMDNYRNSTSLYCAPRSVTVGQLGDMFRKHLRDDPEHRDLYAGTLVVGMLVRAFPCKGV